LLALSSGAGPCPSRRRRVPGKLSVSFESKITRYLCRAPAISSALGLPPARASRTATERVRVRCARSLSSEVAVSESTIAWRTWGGMMVCPLAVSWAARAARYRRACVSVRCAARRASASAFPESMTLWSRWGGTMKHKWPVSHEFGWPWPEGGWLAFGAMMPRGYVQDKQWILSLMGMAIMFRRSTWKNDGQLRKMVLLGGFILPSFSAEEALRAGGSVFNCGVRSSAPPVQFWKGKWSVSVTNNRPRGLAVAGWCGLGTHRLSFGSGWPCFLFLSSLDLLS